MQIIYADANFYKEWNIALAVFIMSCCDQLAFSTDSKVVSWKSKINLSINKTIRIINQHNFIVVQHLWLSSALKKKKTKNKYKKTKQKQKPIIKFTNFNYMNS